MASVDNFQDGRRQSPANMRKSFKCLQTTARDVPNVAVQRLNGIGTLAISGNPERAGALLLEKSCRLAEGFGDGQIGCRYLAMTDHR